jgi:hypothetical protein
MATAQECSDNLCECVRLAALTNDLQIRDQLIAAAWLWLGPAMPALRAARGDWPFLHADEHSSASELSAISPCPGLRRPPASRLAHSGSSS